MEWYIKHLVQYLAHSNYQIDNHTIIIISSPSFPYLGLQHEKWQCGHWSFISILLCRKLGVEMGWIP